MKQGDSPASLEPGKHLLTEPFLNESEVYGNLLLSHNFVCNVKGRSALLRVQEFEGQGNTEAFEAPASSDQLVVVIPKGQGEVESFSDGFWRNATYQPGSVGMTPSGQTSRLRVRPHGPEALHTLHLHIPTHFFESAAEEYRRAGAPSRKQPLNALAFWDPVVSRVALSLKNAVETGAPDFYAEAAAQFLAAHLLSKQSGWQASFPDTRSAGRLLDRRLASVLEYMKVHYAEPLSLDQLAAEAGVSRFHFISLFKENVGITPHRYLVQLRMTAAAALLNSRELSILEVALACGYQSAAHFTSAFVQHYSQTPSQYRKGL